MPSQRSSLCPRLPHFSPLTTFAFLPSTLPHKLSAPKFQPPYAHNLGPLGRPELGWGSRSPTRRRAAPGVARPLPSREVRPLLRQALQLLAPQARRQGSAPQPESAWPLHWVLSLKCSNRRASCPGFSELRVEGAGSLDCWVLALVLSLAASPLSVSCFSMREMGKTSFAD